MLGLIAVPMACFPHDDATFAAFVNACRDELAINERSDPLELQTRIRRQHRFAVVRAQTHLGALGDPTWYVYRDGKPSFHPGGDWWSAPDAAHVILDTRGTCVEADNAAAALVGLGPGALIGKSWRDIVPPTAEDLEASALTETLTKCRWLQSEFDCPLPGGGCRVIECRIERAPDRDQWVSFWRELLP